MNTPMTPNQIRRRCAEIDAAVRAEAEAYRAARAARQADVPVLTDAEWEAQMEAAIAEIETWDAPCSGVAYPNYRVVEVDGEARREFTPSDCGGYYR